MFTGLVEALTEVVEIQPRAEGAALKLRAVPAIDDLSPGDSLAVNGCCLTLTRPRGDEWEFDVLKETLRRTNLGGLIAGSPVNLERPLRADARLGGHFVQGHVDATAPLLERNEANGDLFLRIALPRDFAACAVFKGSISLNGVSLTVAEITGDSLAVWIIPHTRRHTNLDALRPGDLLNLEFDILGKYVERITSLRGG